MTDNVDFKAAKADAEYKKANSNTARALLAALELLKDAFPFVQADKPWTEEYRAKIEAEIRTAIGA